MHTRTARLGALALFTALGLTIGCSSDQKHPEEPTDGPMERAGEAVDDTAEDVEQGAEDAIDETGEAADSAGESIEDATSDDE